MAELTDLLATWEKIFAAILDDLTIKIQQTLTETQISTNSSSDNFGIQMGIKLDGHNYAQWSQVMEMYIAGKDKLGYILGDTPQPEPIDPAFRSRDGSSTQWSHLWLVTLSDIPLHNRYGMQ